MSWVNLQNSLGTRPHVVAGPVLRRVTPGSVTVWLAMRVGATVTLTVLDDQNNQRMTGSQRSLAIGANLHLVAVTATVPPPLADLTEGVVYQYDLGFVFDDGAPGTLTAATAGAPLSYAPFSRPSFALPPKDLTLLRLIQGSCRKPHADGPDALAMVDDLIAPTAGNGFARPHQLLLAGDQVYADDVAAIMLHMLIDASTALLGWTETMPISVDFGGTFKTAAQFPSFLRRPVLAAQGFTSDDLDSHLMSLGEYLTMYLFVWSGVLWPPGNLPELSDVKADIRDKRQALVSQNPPPLQTTAYLLPFDLNDKIEKHRDNVKGFRTTLPAIRRVLANLPTYMIFDDHEVTDDWNMTRDFCRDVYGSPLGQRVVQNAVTAYAFCQHWGNVPEDLMPATPATPGSTLYGLLDTPNPTAAGAFAQKATAYDAHSVQIRGLIGLHDAPALNARAENAVFHEPFSLRYDYSVVGPGHQVIVTDTRTWRAFPTDSDGATHLLTKNAQTDQFAAQILNAPDPKDRQLLVVITTNAPPVQPIRSGTHHDRLANTLAHNPDIYEAWDLPSVSFDRLLTALTSKLPPDATGRRTGSAILLSGDVHFSFASRIIYRATNRFEDSAPHPATAVVAQLVNSAIKNQSDDTVRFHRDGHFAAPHAFITQRLIRQAMTEGYVGFNVPKGSNTFVGVRHLAAGLEGIRLQVLTTVDVTPNFAPQVTLVQQPDYRYRIDYLRPSAQSFQFPRPAIPPIPGGAPTPEQRRKAAQTYDATSAAFRSANTADTPDVVGVNGIGELRFEGATAATRKVNQIVHWKQPVLGVTALTTYTVRLDVNSPTDPEFPDIPVTVTP
jgi:PhoD-like phosphatase